MPEIDLDVFVREVHGYMTNQCEAKPFDEKARFLREAAWKRIQNRTPIFFAWSAPGFLLIGEAERPVIIADPHLAGLADAWEIFLAGPTAGSVMVSMDLAGAPGGSALRNRLEKAAEWAERYAGCPALAKAMRSPSIVVGRDGGIEYNASHHRPLILNY